MADDSISFDYRFYVEFFKEISQLEFDTFLLKAIRSFPYFPWSGFGQFETGFALITYPLSCIFSPSLTYALIACASLFVKLEALRYFKVDVFKILLFYVFDVILFESNALRAGIALAIIMVSLVIFVKSQSFLLLLFITLSASLFHISSLAIFGLALTTLVIFKSGLKGFGLFMLAIVSFVVMNNLALILDAIGGKLASYVKMAQDFDVYTGASGLNAASLLCIMFAIFFGGYVRKKDKYAVDVKNIQLLFFYATILSFSIGVLILFSGIFSIIGDRLWQLVLPQILIILGSYKNLTPMNLKSHHGRTNRLSFGTFPLFNLAVNFLLFHYIVIGLLVRYPQTNFFSWITGTVTLEAQVF